MEPNKSHKRRGQVIDRGPRTFLIRIPKNHDEEGRRCYHNETFYGSRTDAESRCIELLAEIQSGRFFEPAKITCGELFDRWIAHCERRGIRAVTLTLYRRTLRVNFREAIGQLPLSRLSTITLQDLFDGLHDRGLKPLTIRNARAILTSALRYAMKLKLINENPIEGIETPKPKRRPVRGMNEDEAVRFVEAARAATDGFKFIFWLYTGLRPAEFIGLRWTSIESVQELKDGQSIEYGIVHVRESIVRPEGGGWLAYEPKTEKSIRDIYIPAWLYGELMEHKRTQQVHARDFGSGYKDNGLVFPGLAGEPRFRTHIASHDLKPLLKAAGLDPSFTLYTIRRSFSSLLRRAGVSAKEVSEQMGHLSTSFTDDVYVTVYDSAKKDMAGKLEQLLAGTQAAHMPSDRIM